MPTPLTILSPALNVSVARAAIRAGADAVYIGAPRFGARQAAGNSIADLQSLVEYARPFGVKILVTLNTLLTDEEMPEAVQMAWDLYHIGVEALIIQDLRLLQQDLPPIRLHASTQCDNRTPEQVIRLRDMGFKRVVLARELSIEEIRHIHDAVGDTVELEAFVHGALCVSYSGRCFMSEVLMGRSANRGCCAQMCRMRYDLLDSNMQEVPDDKGRPIHQRYLLSLQDMDRSLYLQELIEAGVTTFKIEGRLKDEAYVTNLTAYYRQLLTGMGCHFASQPSRFQYDFTPNPEKTFHRGGIDYFLHGRTPHMANFDTPKSTGERITSDTVLHPGDGLCFGDQGFSVNRIEGARIVANKPITIPRDAELFRNYDAEFHRHLRAERRVEVPVVFTQTAQGFQLQIGTSSREFIYPHEPAKNPERALRTIRDQIAKLGDTIYVASSVELKTDPYFIPISTLNEWRRSVLMPHDE